MDEAVFGRYRLISVIGEGGMGTVYRAHDTTIDRDVAIKVLPPQLATDPNYEQRFRREAHTAARLSEPHIIPIYDTGEIDGRLYLAMPIIEGTDVDAMLRRDGPMPPQRAVHIIEQLAAALDAAHAVGLVHRDIKPSNTLVTGRDFVYLIDFGIAHDASATKLTSTGMLVGTMAYMAPERFTTGVSDARSDVYALACVLHECLTCQQPFPGDGMERQIAGHLSADPPRPSQSRPDLAAFDDVIATGMAKKPDARYQSAHQLATAARHALTAPPVAAPTRRHDQFPPPPPVAAPSQHYPPPPPPPQHTQPTQAAPLPNWSPYQPQQPYQPYQPYQPVPQPPRRATGLIVGLAAVAVIAVVVIAITAVQLLKPDPSGQADRTSTTPTTQATTSSVPTTTTPTVPLVTESALEGFLLGPDRISNTMGATGMAVTGPKYPTSTYDGTGIEDKECVPMYGPAEGDAYTGSGWTHLLGQELRRPSKAYPYVIQAVVLFPSARQASAFFTASAQSWQACSNRQFSYANTDGRHDVWIVGPLSNTNGILSSTRTMKPYTVGNTNYTGACQRALTVANNVVVDVRTCAEPPGGTAVNIALEIAAKVPTS